MSTTSVDQGVTDYATSMSTFHKTTDAIEDRSLKFSDKVEPSNVLRRSSVEVHRHLLMGASVGPTSRGSFSFGSLDPVWNAVNKSKEERAPLARSHSFASNFTSMTGDELSDEVEPWAMDADARFDFGFSSALRDCLRVQYAARMHRRRRPTSVTGPSTEVDESEEDVMTEEDEEPGRRRLSRRDSRSPIPALPVGASSEFLASSWLPDAWAPATPVRLIAEFPRRSTRISRPSPEKLTHREEPPTPTKRKRPASKGNTSILAI
ncbi:hypothetical protein B0H11DRAFT_2187940 [Mycena galericulata]|nr:hypothetical protein B0H11DRAFT_2187940 [Mycena galericulata]